jgi:hypothetical protein
MCPSVGVLAFDSNTAVLYHISVVKCPNDLLKFILDDGLVADVKLQLPGLHANRTSIFSIFFFL